VRTRPDERWRGSGGEPERGSHEEGGVPGVVLGGGGDIGPAVEGRRGGGGGAFLAAMAAAFLSSVQDGSRWGSCKMSTNSFLFSLSMYQYY
jgi:hypothetical protein